MSLSLSQKKFSHFKFETYYYKKKILKNDELYSFIIIHTKKKKKVIYKFYKLLFVNFFFLISKLEMVSKTIIFIFSILKIVFKSESQTHKI